MSDEIHALTGAYAVDALDETERAHFEQHLAECADCRAEVESLRLALTDLSSLTEVAPPAGLRASVLSGIRQERPLPARRSDAAQTSPDAGQPHVDSNAGLTAEPDGATDGNAAGDPAGDADGDAVVVPISRGARNTRSDRNRNDRSRSESARRGPGRGLLAAAAAAVFVIGGFGVYRATSGDDAPPSVATAVLEAPDATRTEHSFAGGGSATIVRSASLGRAVLVGSNLPATPAGQTYQLWLQSKAGAFTSAGLVPGAGNQVVVLEGDASAAAGAGITVEPAGGSPQPTTKPVALFSFSA